MKFTTKRDIQFSIFAIAVVVAFTGCSTNNASPSSGTYDADTFREKFDPDPNVDYSLQKKKKKKKLNLPSGTYDAATFRVKFDPDPNVDYGYGYGKGSSASSSSSGSLSSSEFWAILGDISIGLINGASDYYANRDNSPTNYSPPLTYNPNQRRSGLHGNLVQSPGGAIVGNVYDEQGQKHKVISGRLPNGNRWVKVK